MPTRLRLLSRHFPRYGRRWLLGLLLTLLACSQADGLFPTTLIEHIDLFFYDMRLRIATPTLDPRIVIVDIDEKSINEVGRFPWSRDKLAELVTQMGGRYKARAIGFDIMFAEADTSSGYATLAALAGGELKDFPALGERVAALKPALDYDDRFARAIKGNPVVLGYFFGDEKSDAQGKAAKPKGLLPAPAFTTDFLNGRALDAYAYNSYVANLPQLQRAAAGAGFFNADIDDDGKLRSSRMLVKYADGYYESLSLATARVALGASAVKPALSAAVDTLSNRERDYGALDYIDIYVPKRARKRITVEHNLLARVDYHGRGGPDGGAFRYVSAVDVMKGRARLDDIGGTIMLVGPSAAGLNDLRSTPVRADFPGVEVHANLIASILDGKFQVKPDYSFALDIGQIVLLGVLLTVAMPLLTPLYSIALALASAALVAGFNYAMATAFALVLPMAAALLLILGLFMLNIAWGYLFEYRNRQAIVSLFGEYVAPELVAEMADNPENYSMEGESRELTVLFADVRGFTTISEGLSPNDLREYINLYLTAMSEDIRGNRGTLDKYIGDAVMAFWGAPVTLPDHAARAVASALVMQRSCETLNRTFVARGWPEIKIGIGLNTGQMRVGDMGSKVRRAYTVMGDAVNLSSRLEGITKIYGVGIVVGDATRLAAPDYAYRELDRVRVKGKNEPVPIFEPLGLAIDLDADTVVAVALWHAALAQVRSQDWDGAQQRIEMLQRQDPARGLFALYLQRIAHFRQHPPPAGWDGVTTFDSK